MPSACTDGAVSAGEYVGDGRDDAPLLAWGTKSPEKRHIGSPPADCTEMGTSDGSPGAMEGVARSGERRWGVVMTM
jgi:hypothetical protein